MNRFNLKSVTAICLLGISGVVSSCEKQTEEQLSGVKLSNGLKTKQSGTSAALLQFAGNGNLINFNSSSDKEYTKALAEGNFGTMVNNSGFDAVPTKVEIVNHELRIKLLANKLSGDGGVIGDFDIEDGPSYEVTYKIKFQPGFDFGGTDKGGKLGFGFGIGDGNTGGVISNGNGGSVRLMWIKLSNGKAVFKPYVYYTNMPDNTGDDLGMDYGYSPNNDGLQTGVFYSIKMRVKSNDNVANNNGEIRISVDGYTILTRTDMNFATVSGKKWIRELLFQTFRGGNTDAWKSQGDWYIYYDDIKYTKDPTETF